MQIRKLGRGDEDLVARAAALFDQPIQPDAVNRFLQSADHHLLLALDGDRPVGFVTGVELTHPDKGVEMFLYELAVAARDRRRGIGTALVEALRDLAAEHGCRGMWVLTDNHNIAALATYRSAGAGEPVTTTMLEWALPGETRGL